ncbi:hypothetical protein [Leptolyngbya phage Lbo-JY46]
MDTKLILSKNSCICPTTTSSKCVGWSGEKLKAIEFNYSDCSNLNLTDIILTYDNIIKQLITNTDVSSLSTDCLVITGDKTLFSYIDALIKKHCQLKADYDDLKKAFDTFNVFAKTLNIDLSCITGGNNCGSGNVHTLANILLTFAKEICAIKKQIN